MCNKEKFWRTLAEALDHPEWCDDPRLVDFAVRLENRALVQELLDAAFGEQTTAVWLERLSGRVPVAPVYDVGAALMIFGDSERASVADYARGEESPARRPRNPVRSPGVTLPRVALGAPGRADRCATEGSATAGRASRNCSGAIA